jgi:hypothetical protein
MHKPENIRGYPYLCIRRGSVERPVEQIKEPACTMNTTDAYRPPESILLLTSLTGIGSEYSLPERLLLLLSTYHDLQPPRHSWLDNNPVGQQYDEEYSLDWLYLKAMPTRGE